MSVWFAIPSKRPPEEADKVLKLWRERGYKIALWLDEVPAPTICHDQTKLNYWISGGANYPGYSQAVNALVADILEMDPQAEWIVTAGDDTEPDPNHSAEEIAKECSRHFATQYFRNLHRTLYPLPDDAEETDMLTDLGAKIPAATFGVMQPTGDRWGENAVPGLQGAYIDRVCGSPWMGREFCRRMYQGNGPLYSGYRHMFEDEELQNVALKLGVLWQRPDLTHYHRHWGRGGCQAMPDFLREVNSAKHWAEAKAMFETRKAGGFPDHQPIA